MPSYNFADQYKMAGLNPGSEAIRLRQEPFDKLREEINIPMILNLTRLYFSLVVPDGTDWFCDAFRETDTSFTMIDNEREVSVLSACLLAAALEDGFICAGLAPIVRAAGGNHTPLVQPEFIEEARQTLAVHSVTSRQQSAINIKLPAKSKVSASVDTCLQSPDWTNIGNAIKLADSSSFEAIKNLTNQVSPLVKEVQTLREEVSILWWCFGGWSRVLEKPFADLDVGLAALMAGLDLAHLAQGQSEPVAAPAILYRLVTNSRNDANKKISLESAVESAVKALTADAETFQRLKIPDTLSSVNDLCPVLTALVKAEEIGGNGAWHGAFKKATGLEPEIKFLPIELAMQIYRELLLHAQID